MKRLTCALRAAVVLLGVAALTGAIARPSSAQTLYYRITSRTSGKVLEAPIVPNLTEIQQLAYNGGMDQQWELVPRGSGYFSIRSRRTGKALEAPLGVVNRGTPIQLLPYTGGPYQQWQLVPRGDGYFAIRSRRTTQVLEAPPNSPNNVVTPIQQSPSDGGLDQHWRLILETVL